MDFFRLPGDFRRHKSEYDRDKKLVSSRYRQQQKESTRQINILNTHMTNTEVKFKKANNKMEQIEKDINNNFKKHKEDIKEKMEEVNSKIDNLKEDVRDELEKVTRLQKQKFDNFKQKANKKFNKMVARIDEMSRNNSNLIDTLKMMMMCFFNKSRNIDEAANNSINTSEVDTNIISRKMFKTLTTTSKKIKNPNKSYLFSDNENSDLNNSNFNNRFKDTTKSYLFSDNENGNLNNSNFNSSFKDTTKSYLFSDNENGNLNNSFTAQSFKFSAALHAPKLEQPEENDKLIIKSMK